jgi:predicted nucleic acid-binding protein
VIVADTGAIVALVDADDRHHAVLRRLFERDPDSWILPWATLPEIDYLLGAHVGGVIRETSSVPPRSPSATGRSAPDSSTRW